MQNPAVQERIKDLSCFAESKHLDKFFETLRESDDKCCYGYNSVEYALKERAIDTLLISDNLFRAKNTATRLQYVKLAEKAEKEYLVNTVIIGTLSPAGERLKMMTGVAAILKYSLPGIDDIDEEDEDDENDEESLFVDGDSNARSNTESLSNFDDS